MIDSHLRETIIVAADIEQDIRSFNSNRRRTFEFQSSQVTLASVPRPLSLSLNAVDVNVHDEMDPAALLFTGRETNAQGKRKQIDFSGR